VQGPQSGGAQAVIRALILAGGASTRMGRPKAVLPLGGGHTVLSRGVRTLVDAGVPGVVIVGGALDPDRLGEALGRLPRTVRVVPNHRWKEGQLTSLLAGLDAIDEPSLEAVLVTLVDVPLVSRETVRHVIQTWRATRAPIVRPAHGERHGHPVMFDRALFEDLRRADPTRGAKDVMRARADRIVNVQVTDDGAFFDADTPEDYQRLRRAAEERRLK
jgi:CTP:molybdopterin cytidylyltransferase MocA